MEAPRGNLPKVTQIGSGIARTPIPESTLLTSILHCLRKLWGTWQMFARIKTSGRLGKLDFWWKNLKNKGLQLDLCEASEWKQMRKHEKMSCVVLIQDISCMAKWNWDGTIGQKLFTKLIYSEPLVAQLVKNLPAMWRAGFDLWVGKIPWRRERLPTPVFWPGEFHGLLVHSVAKSWTQLSDFHFTFH